MLYQKNWYIYIYIYYLLVTAVVVTEKVASFFSEALKAAFNKFQLKVIMTRVGTQSQLEFSLSFRPIVHPITFKYT